MNNTSVSAGLGFMRAAFNGIGKSVGDRERSKLLHEAMEIAIKGKMAFDLDDVEPMKRLQMTTSVGVFRPFSDHNYFTACLAGERFAGCGKRPSTSNHSKPRWLRYRLPKS